MKRLLVYCEGPTEESFIKTVFAPYFLNMNVIAIPIGVGGVSKYSIIKKELIRICKKDYTATVTTMLDYYGLPKETPGISTATGNIYDKAKHIETSVHADLGGLANLIFNLSVHEYEGLLFSSVSAFEGIADDEQLVKLQNINNDFETPEHINNSYYTAPSRRLEKIISGYSKVNDGTTVARRIGIDDIAAKCKHFGEWIAKLTAWAKEGVQ